MAPTRKQIQLDVMQHFALGVVRAGSEFDLKGFWRLTIPRYLLTDRDFEEAMASLVAMGLVEQGTRRFHLTAKGAAHLHQCVLWETG